MEKLLEIYDLSVEYRAGVTVSKAVNHLNLTVNKGEAIGLVGESGAGKTTTALSIMNLLPAKVGFITGGSVVFEGEQLLKMSDKKLGDIRGEKIAMVFQNPLTSLNPVFTVGRQIAMVLNRHKHMDWKEAYRGAENLLKLVGIAGYRINDYPHQFSGGMRQRVGIAAALACDPELLICDEPTTALDVTIQAQILELMKALQKNYDTSLLMITHNLGIVAELCQRVAIMYGGEIIEIGQVREVFENPQHYYTIGLLNALPKLYGERTHLASIPGNVANSQMLPSGCRFHPRCKQCMEKCKTEAPPVTQAGEDHWTACWKTREGKNV
jgi:peptide/nickel transport system ATP-binding protein